MKRYAKVLVIKEFDEVVFKCLVYFGKKRYFRALIDKLGYGKMMSELIYDGYVEHKKRGESIITFGDEEYKEDNIEGKHIVFKNLDELVEFLKERDFEVEVYDEMKKVAEVSTDGEDLGYEVIKNSNKILFNNLSSLWFETTQKAVNNLPFEPFLLDKASSYAVEIKDNIVDKNLQVKMLELVDDIKKGKIDKERFWDKGFYYKFILELNKSSKLKKLKVLKFEIDKDHFVSFDRDDLYRVALNVENIINEKVFEYDIDNFSDTRAHDHENLSFKLNAPDGATLFCHAKDMDMYRKITDQNSYPLRVKGYFVSAKTVSVESAVSIA